jgi:predicted RND superfamily exporter protein
LCDELPAAADVVQVERVPAPEPGMALVVVALADRAPGSRALDLLAEVRQRAPPTVRVLAAGLPRLEAVIAAEVAAERLRIVPWIAGALLLVAGAIYRHLGLALGTLLPALLGIVWTSGLVARLGHELDPVQALLDPVLLTLGVASSVHFVEAWRRGRSNGLLPRAAARFAIAEQRTPACLAAVTTMLGLYALAIGTVPAVVDFGVRAAFGTALVHALTFLVLPVWLPLVAGRAPAPPPAAHGELRADRWLGWLEQRRMPLLAGTAALSAVLATGLPNLRSDNDPLHLLPADNACRIEHEQLAARLGGIEPCHLLVPARSPGTELGRLLPFLAAMHLLPGVTGLGGPVRSGAEGDLAAALLLAPGGSAQRVPTFAAMDRAARVLGLDGTAVAGPAVQVARDSDRLIASLLGSLGVTLALLLVGLCVGLRSWRLGLLGMVPTVLPCVWVYGAIGLLGRPVSVATAMIGCTMLGLIVDNTLHLLHQLRLARPAASPRGALVVALRHCGRAICLSSGVLVIGFGAGVTSHLSTTVEFSVLAGATILAAWFGVLWLLPLVVTGTTGRAEEPVHGL